MRNVLNETVASRDALRDCNERRRGHKAFIVPFYMHKFIKGDVNFYYTSVCGSLWYQSCARSGCFVAPRIHAP